MMIVVAIFVIGIFLIFASQSSPLIPSGKDAPTPLQPTLEAFYQCPENNRVRSGYVMRLQSGERVMVGPAGHMLLLPHPAEAAK